MILNGSAKTVLALIDGKIREMTTELDELKAARRELTGGKRAQLGGGGLAAPRPGAQAGGKAKEHAVKQRASWTPNDRERMKALMVWAGSSEFDAGTLSKHLKANPKSMSPWLSKCVYQGRLLKPERGVFRVAKGANK